MAEIEHSFSNVKRNALAAAQVGAPAALNGADHVADGLEAQLLECEERLGCPHKELRRREREYGEGRRGERATEEVWLQNLL